MELVRRIRVTVEFLLTLILGVTISHIFSICVLGGIIQKRYILNGEIESFGIISKIKYWEPLLVFDPSLSAPELLLLGLFALNIARFIHSYIILSRDQKYQFVLNKDIPFSPSKPEPWHTIIASVMYQYLPLLQFITHVGIVVFALFVWQILGEKNLGTVSIITFSILLFWHIPALIVIHNSKYDDQKTLNAFGWWVILETSLFFVAALLMIFFPNIERCYISSSCLLALFLCDYSLNAEFYGLHRG